MWRYTHTDEMYHSLVNGKELIHSEVYLGQEYSDGFKHYRYLKKVKSPSGKWRYIYDESDLKAEEKKIKAMDKTLDTMRDKSGYVTYKDKSGASVSSHKDGHTITNRVLGVQNKYKQSAKDKAKEKLLTETEKKKKKHNKQKLKDIPKRVISKGIGAVGKFMYDTEKKWIKK